MQTAITLGLCDEDLNAFLNLDCSSIESQAQTLIQKRLREVATLLPETFRRAGIQAIIDFEDYADSYWPTGHRRHLDDAAQFCKFLNENERPLCHAEFNRVRFAAQERRFCLHFVRDATTGSKLRCALQLLFRRRQQKTQEISFYLAL